MSVLNNRHDFINNAIRIDILNKLICEAIEKNIDPNEEYVQDLTKFLEDHIKYLKTDS